MSRPGGRTNWRCAMLAVYGLAVAPPLVAQDSIPDADPGSTLVPIPAIFYQPETGTAFGAVVNYFFRPGYDEGPLPPPSSIMVSAIYTTKNQILAALVTELYPTRATYWFLGAIEYQRFPTKFWGVGNDAPENSEEDYTPLIARANVDLQRLVAKNLYVGITAQWSRRTLSVVEPGGILATGSVNGIDKLRILGGGLLATYDTRDRRIAPRRGWFYSLRGVVYPAAFGNDDTFGSVTVDLRRYVPVTEGHVVALRAFGIASSGPVPFDLLPALGGDMLLRGYFQGRFRDQHLVALQSEYRVPLFWIVRGVAFGSVGQVAPGFGDFGFDRFKLTAGGGLRVVLNEAEGFSIRVDYAWGFAVGSGGLYFGINEAF